jgi:DeoR/GlpR family transcriptional regulator of sugar metabolism
MSKPLIPAQRRDRIQEYLAIHQIARSVDLCSLLDTSEATVRRDLEWLEQKGILERTHGGAILSQRMLLSRISAARAASSRRKKRIGELPLRLLKMAILFLLIAAQLPLKFFSAFAGIASLYTQTMSALLRISATGFRYYLTGANSITFQIFGWSFRAG